MVDIHAPDQAVIEQITSAILAHSDAWLPPGAFFPSEPPGIELHSWSIHVRYPGRDASGRPFALLLKIYRPQNAQTITDILHSTHSGDYGRLEYKILESVYQAVQGSDAGIFCAIKPLGYLEDWHAIVMEEFRPAPQPVRNLLAPRLLLNRDRDWQAVEAALQRMGRWLSLFHNQVGRSARAVVPFEQRKDSLRAPLRRLSNAMGPRFQAQPLEDALLDAIRRVDDPNLVVSLVHADFNCTNAMLCSDGRLLVLDFNDSRPGVIDQDLAHVIVELWTHRYQIFSGGLFIRPERLRRCVGALLKDYQAGPGWNRGWLHIFCARDMLDKWSYTEEQIRSTGGVKGSLMRLLRPYLRACYRRIYFQFLDGSLLES
jgi:hypothetical protein